ncbi:MAG: spore coat protein [Oscillospiraceae bacterium]|jgi:spore coat protein CotF|nr:spore coat protein [Oscillospiraceae bacterium]
MPNQQKFQDQEILTDMLGAQKQAAGSYNTFSAECTNQNLKNDMLNILRDEQSIQSGVFGEMHRRGWYQPQPAQQQQVDQTRTKFEGISQQLG